MLIENASDEEDPHFIERLIRDPPKARNKESEILKYYKEPKLTATANRMAESLRIRNLTKREKSEENYTTTVNYSATQPTSARMSDYVEHSGTSSSQAQDEEE